jgi:murein DD-endopeptidase MepM/ murein hydrolase activator NlpD
MRRIYLIPGAIVALIILTGVPAWMRSEAPATPRSANTDVVLPVESVVVQDVVPPNTTLDLLLRKQGLISDAAAAVVEAASRVFDPRRLRSRQPFELERSFDGAFRRFEYEIDADAFLRVAATEGSEPLRAEVLPIPVTVQHAAASAEVTREASSLFAAMKAAGEGDELAIAMATVLSGEIDFNSEVQLGDRLAVAFERRQREGRPSTYGEISAAEFSMSEEGRTVRAIRFTTPDGRAGYYDEQGRSLKRMFLKSPLKFEPRVTSGFSMSRMHPVLHTSRAHRGVDYGAPTGAPVVAVASGSVVSVTQDGSNGRMVRLRHGGGYQTNYLHLSRFAAGIRAGGHVDQGDLIGYVGSSGLATGPHLHFGLTKNGAFVNPIAEHRKMPPGEPVPESSLAAFGDVRDKALAELAAAGNARAARLAASRQ